MTIPAENRTSAFIYLDELDAIEFDRLFERLFLPAPEWRRRLRLTAREMKALLAIDMKRPRVRVHAYRSALHGRKCYLGRDIKRALIYLRRMEQGAACPLS